MDRLAPQTQIGRYAIESMLGSGGFATVYAATDTDGQQVALKILSATVCADPILRRRVAREADILAKLRHRGIVRLVGRGETDDGSLYLAFERLPGEDLRELLAREHRLEPDVVLAILRQVLDALRAAHRAGIVHRDIKPENIRVLTSPDGNLDVRLLDFGIARVSEDGSPGLTATGELLGTPRYMSPEQITNGVVGPSSDIYSLGVTMLECLLGDEAMHGSRLTDQIDRLHSGHVFAIGAHFDNSPKLFETLNRMTARKVEDRLGTAAAVLAALDGQVSPQNPQRRSVRANWVAPSVIAAVTLVVLAAFLFRSEGNEEPTPEQPSTLRDLAFLNASGADGEPLEPAGLEAKSRDVGAENPPVESADGCGKPALDSADWPFHTHLPSTYDPDHRHPLLIMYHDDFVNPGSWIHSSGFAKLADTERFIIVAPRSANPVGAGAWRSSDEPVMTTTESVAGFATTAFCVDPTRIFLVGHGHGGAAVVDVCAPWVTAAATYAHHFDFVRTCPDRPVPFLMMFPDGTGHMPVDGGQNCDGRPAPSKSQREKTWLERNGCSKRSEKFDVPGATCKRRHCKTAFVSCLYEGGRNWPNTPRHQMNMLSGLAKELQQVDKCDGAMPLDFNPAQTAWKFFDSVDPLAPNVAYRLR